MGGRTVIGLIITVAWFSAAALYVYELGLVTTWRSLEQWPGLLFDNRGELAFFWLVLGYLWLVIGYFQQQAELRRSSTLIGNAAMQAEAAINKVETESQRFENYQKSRIGAAQPHWKVQGCIAHREQHEINICNVGAPASDLHALWNRELPIAVVLSNAAVVERGQQFTIKVVFSGTRLEEFDLMLEYCDALGELHRAHIHVAEMEVVIQNQEPHVEFGLQKQSTLA